MPKNEVKQIVSCTGYCPKIDQEREINLMCIINYSLNAAIPYQNRCIDAYECDIVDNCPIFEKQDSTRIIP